MACKMNEDRIKLMHKLFGIDEKHICKTCENLITVRTNKSYNKCICYGKHVQMLQIGDKNGLHVGCITKNMTVCQ